LGSPATDEFWSLIAAVGEQLLQERKHPKQGRHDQNAAIAILNIGRMDKRGGGKRTVVMREVVNGLMYILSTGFLDTYRTMCLAPQPDFRRVLAGVLAMELAA
jgi:hypothetical protein